MANRDTLIHMEKAPMPSFTNAQMRDFIAAHTGLVGSLPKTVGTLCGKRRNVGRTSTRPEAVTCPVCRAEARAEALRWVEIGESALRWLDPADEKRKAIEDETQKHRDRAEQFSS